jgi:hypothetical protein
MSAFGSGHDADTLLTRALADPRPRQSRTVGRIWSQLTLAHNTLIWFSNILYLIFKLAVALRQSFDDHIGSFRHIQTYGACRKQTFTDLESVLGHDAPHDSRWVERGRTSGLAPTLHPTTNQSSSSGRGQIKARPDPWSPICNTHKNSTGHPCAALACTQFASRIERLA